MRGGVRYALHAVQQAEFLVPDLLGSGVTAQAGFGLTVGGVNLQFFFLRFQGLGVLGPGLIVVVVGFWAQGLQYIVVGSCQLSGTRWSRIATGTSGRVSFLPVPTPSRQCRFTVLRCRTRLTVNASMDESKRC